jgi:hypothetical protein
MSQPDRRGERNPHARLKPNDVREILTSAETYEALAEKYSIHPTYVWKLKTKKRWSHLDEQ